MSDLPEKMGPIPSDSTLLNLECRACNERFHEGDSIALVALGPGNDSEEQEKARNNRPYNAVAIPIHYACATGITNPT